MKKNIKKLLIAAVLSVFLSGSFAFAQSPHPRVPKLSPKHKSSKHLAPAAAKNKLPGKKGK